MRIVQRKNLATPRRRERDAQASFDPSYCAVAGTIKRPDAKQEWVKTLPSDAAPNASDESNCHFSVTCYNADMTKQPNEGLDRVSNRQRQALKSSAYRICKVSGIAAATISRFKARTGFNLESVDKLCGVLGLRLVDDARAPKARKAGK